MLKRNIVEVGGANERNLIKILQKLRLWDLIDQIHDRIQGQGMLSLSCACNLTDVANFRQETKAEEPKIPKKVSVERNVVSAGKSATKSKATPASETPEKPTAPKPKKTAKSTAKFAKGFAALDLYPEAKRSCFVCQEEQPESKSYNMGCRNRHWSCVDCLKAGFEAYFVDFENPPRCCGPPVNFHQVATTVFLKERHRDFLERGLQRMADLSTMMADKKHDFHCAAPDCGTSLKKLGKSGDKKFGVCSKCEKKTCETCKSPWPRGHSSEKCHNAGDTEVEVLAKSLKLKSTTCPHCGISNVKTEGCNLVLW